MKKSRYKGKAFFNIIQVFQSKYAEKPCFITYFISFTDSDIGILWLLAGFFNILKFTIITVS